MKVLHQSLDTGKATIIECPDPTPMRSRVIVDARRSVISAGTERMLVGFGRAGLLGKLSQGRDKLADIRAKIRANGLLETYASVRAKLSQPITLGYAMVGVVRQAPQESGLAPGDRVVTNASHGDTAQVPLHLCLPLPESITDDEAVFIPLAAIALQGIHLLDPKPGQKIMVVGLGLIGQLAARILLARGCQVLGIDPARARVDMAVIHGVQSAPPSSSIDRAALSWTAGKGVDGVIIAASSNSSEIVNAAAAGCKPRGRVISVGVVGLNLQRPIFFKSEVSLQVSYSYGDKTRKGPGSAHSNFIEIADLMASGRLKVLDLISSRHDFSNAPAAYDELVLNSRSLGILIEYPAVNRATYPRTLPPGDVVAGTALIGAGNFATRTLLPALREINALRLSLVVSTQGHQAMLAAQKFAASAASTDEAQALSLPHVNPIFLCTRHDAHARQTIAALAAGKSVWVEKPLALKAEDIDLVAASARTSSGILMVGFNRRFAPTTTKLKAALAGRPGCRNIRITVNAGRLDSDHWTLDPVAGGGRIVGEACHFVDLSRAIVESPILSIRCTRRDTDGQDGGCFELYFVDGSSAVIDYRTDLPPEVPKERISVYGKDWSAEIHNWARLTSSGLGVSLGWPWSKAPKKGHPEALRAFLAAADGKAPAPIPLHELLEVSRASILMQGLSEGEAVSL